MMLARVSKLALLLVLTACDPGDVVLLAPDKSPSDAPTFTIHAVIDTPYVDVADALGWTPGVPGATVRVHRRDEPYDPSSWVTALTDSAGGITLPDLLSGLYEVAVRRELTPDERAVAGATVHIVAGGRRMRLPAGAEAVTLAPDRRGSLLLSEVAIATPVPWEISGGLSMPTKYFEIYNNSDTTIYLDGKYWAMGYHFLQDFPSWPCAETGELRNDPLGVWVQMVFRFPGSGTSHPLSPGETVLVAKSAIDHRALHPGLFDLSHADFEWVGARTVDNPQVPNLEEISIIQTMPHHWPTGQMPLILSEPVDLATLPRHVDPVSGYPWVRIPAASVLDAWVDVIDWTTYNYSTSLSCLEDLHRSFERLAGPAQMLSDFEQSLSYQRRVVGTLPDGRKLLQDTDTSMEDFVKAQRTPGWIPDSAPLR
jgi:hypothetical protein